jgi:ParB-like chromosome segregation protein Spo0J
MRKQYHFRKVGNDTYIWDVHNLVEITKKFQVKEIPLSEIKELEEPYWYPYSHPTTQEIIEHMQLILEADLSYPIILCSQGRLMDGMHRVAKAKILGKDLISVVQFDVDPKPDFINIDEDDLTYDD